MLLSSDPVPMIEFPARRRARHLTFATLVLILWAVLVMLALKLLVGWATGSLAILATAMHTLLTSFSTLMGLQSSRFFVQRPREWPSCQGSLATGTLFLMWSLLGFGGLSLLVLVVQRWQGIAGAAPLQVSIALIQLMGLLGLVSFCFALVERYMAGVTESLLLSGNARLLLQEAWLNLLVLCGLLVIRYGYKGVDLLLVPLILLLVILNAWRNLQRHWPQLFRPQAIAPEAIAHLAQRIDGVLRCISAQSHGLVGRQVQIHLQLLIHPEFESLATSIGQRIEATLRHHYGSVDVTIELVNENGSRRQRLDLNAPPTADLISLDYLDWN